MNTLKNVFLNSTIVSEEKLVDLIAGDDTIDIDSMVGKLNEMNERKQDGAEPVAIKGGTPFWNTFGTPGTPEAFLTKKEPGKPYL